MLVLVSPAKKLDFDSLIAFDEFSQPEFIHESKELIKNLKGLSMGQVSTLMKLSAKLSKLNFDRYRDFKTPFNLNNAKQAGFTFNGDTYVGLDINTLSKSELKQAPNHLRILSGLYGVLKPFDLIQPYRLEMGTRLKGSDYKNLYDFWGTKITTKINEDIKETKAKALVVCASKEYASVVQFGDINVPVIEAVFKERKDDNYKIIGLFAKRARGMMARYVIQNKVKNIEDLKLFNSDGYVFNKKLSTDTQFTFTRG
jgi:cytoplasmic iron level regulating protein YaaA (DUF328/UPF0246 family)